MANDAETEGVKMAKRVNKKVVTVHDAIVFGLAHGPSVTDPNLRVACACYFAVHHFPQLGDELNRIGDEHSRKHAGL